MINQQMYNKILVTNLIKNLIKKNNTTIILDGNTMESNKDNGMKIINRKILINKELINILSLKVILINYMDIWLQVEYAQYFGQSYQMMIILKNQK